MTAVWREKIDGNCALDTKSFTHFASFQSRPDRSGATVGQAQPATTLDYVSQDIVFDRDRIHEGDAYRAIEVVKVRKRRILHASNDLAEEEAGATPADHA